MPDSDFYHQKTDAQLLFLVEHPAYYQPDVLVAARRELRRRSMAAAPPKPAPAPAEVADVAPSRALVAAALAASTPTSIEVAGVEEGGAAAPAQVPAGFRPGPLVLAVGAVLALSLGIFYIVWQKNRPPKVQPAVVAAPVVAAAPVRKAPFRPVEVATSVIPNYDGVVAQAVEQELARVPAAERAAAADTLNGQALRQFRGLAERFWTAETQTEYVLGQARQGRFTPALASHVESVLTTWQQWDNATMYSYEFGPVMASQFGLMGRVARQQQEELHDLLRVANTPRQYENDKSRQRAAAVSALLAGLLPKSPVTGEPYAPL